MVWCLEFGWVLSVVGLLVLLAVGDPWSLSLWWIVVVVAAAVACYMQQA